MRRKAAERRGRGRSAPLRYGCRCGMDLATNGIFIFRFPSLVTGSEERKARGGAGRVASTPETPGERRPPASVERSMAVLKDGRPPHIGQYRTCGRPRPTRNGGMFEKRDDDLCCCAVTGTQRTGMAAERPTIIKAALARAVSGAGLPLSAWTEPDVQPRPPRVPVRGMDTRIRCHAARAALRRPRATLHVTHHGTLSGTHCPALYLPTDPDSPVGTPVKCVCTSRARRLSSASSARPTGNEMACIGNATCGHGGEVPTANQPGAMRDNPAVAATHTEPSRPEPRALEVARRGVARRRMPSARRVETVEVRGRIGGAGAFRKRRGGGVLAMRAEVVARVWKKKGQTAGCADFRGIGGGRQQDRLTPDNCCYRASIR